MRKWIHVLTVTILIVGTTRFLTTTEKIAPTLVINEVCSRNGFVETPEEYLGDDYIELYNTTDKTICLDGWYLSDDPEKPEKQPLPEVYLEPYEFVVFYANGEDFGEHSLNFKINAEGETLFLTNPDGVIVDEVYIPPLSMDQVYARKNDGGSEWIVQGASLGTSNAKAKEVFQVTLNEPIFSHGSGFYDEEFILTMTAGKKQKIYYTTDGSIPTEKSKLYQDGILIRNVSDQENVINSVKNVVADWKDYKLLKEKADKATVIRAIAIDENHCVSEVVTKTYMVGLDRYKEGNVVSIVAEPSSILGDNGIFVTGPVYDNWYLNDEMSSDNTYHQGWTTNYELTNFWGRGRKYEVFGNMQLFEEGTETINQKVGVKVQGNFTRMADKKSLQLVSRGVYSGDHLFQGRIFDGYDSHAIYVSAYPEKAYFMKLAKDRNLGIQNARECAVFINGEYWYTAALLEKYDEKYFEQHYGVNSENVLLVKDREAKLGQEYYYLYDDLLNYLRDESITQEEKAETLYEQFDVQSLIDWLCFNLYLGNDDISYRKNCVMWRTIEAEDSAYGDCKWRWLVYDIDHAAIGAAPEVTDFQEFSIISDNRFYWALRTNPQFCEQFVISAMDMMNTTFSMENVEKVLGEWGLNKYYSNGYFLKRPEYMIESLRKEFELTGTVEEVRLSVNDTEAGKVYINTTEADMFDSTWTGKYFTDYPIKVTAVANTGYQFVGWSGDYESSQESINMNLSEEGISLTAIFEKR